MTSATQTASRPEMSPTTIYVGGESHILVCDLHSDRLDVRRRLACGAMPSFLAFAPRREMVVAVNENDDTLVSLKLEQDGDLTVMSHAPSPGGPAYVAFDRAERWVLVANYGGGTVTVRRLQTDGSFGDVTCNRATGKYAHSIVATADNESVFVANKGTDQVSQFSFDVEHGKLIPRDPPFVATQPGSGPRHLDFHPAGDRAYLVNENDCTITAFSLDGGQLRDPSTQSTLPRPQQEGDTGSDVHVTPDGRFVIASSRGHDSLAVFRVAGDDLDLVEHVSTGGKVPRNFSILGKAIPGDCRVLVANQESGTIVGFEQDPESGRLQRTFESDVGERAFWVGPCPVLRSA